MINKPGQGKNKIIWNISSCVIQKCNGYVVVKVEKKNPEEWLFEPIDIVYDTVQNFEDIVNCYFKSICT